jgi:3-phenylpropionate/trans-cinnamate dioxygenase ferredoxin component
MRKRWVTMGQDSEIPEGETRIFEAEGTRVAVCRVEGELFAIEDLCSHDDGPLGEGPLEGHEIECPRHGARFDVRTGAACRMPAAAPVPVFPIKVEHGDVFVELEID